MADDMKALAGPYSYTGDEDGDFVIWYNEDFVANVGASSVVPVPPTQMAFDIDKENAERIVKALNMLAALEAGGMVMVPEFDRLKPTLDECKAEGAAYGWCPCTGCHETNEGASTGDYRYSRVFDCEQGAGCHECGGLGVVWFHYDAASLEDMARETPMLAARPQGGK